MAFDQAIVRQEPEFDFLSEEYKALFAASNATAFQSPEWLHTFYNKLTPSVDAEPLIVTVRDQRAGTLNTVLPLVRQRSFGAKIVQPADLGVSDYNTAIAKPEDLQNLAQSSFAKAQIADNLKPFDALIFRKQRDDTSCVSNLFSGAVISANENAAYKVVINEPFDDWFSKTLSKNFRSSYRRGARKIEREVGTLEFELATEPADIKAAFDFMRSVRQEKFEGDLFCTPAYFEFYFDYAVMTAEEKRSFTYVGRLDGRIVSVEFGLVKDGIQHMIHGCFAPELAKYSMGHLSLFNFMRDRSNEDCKVFDFTIGDHYYKQRLNAQKTTLSNAVVANGPVGELIGLTYRRGRALKNFIKQLDRRIN